MLAEAQEADCDDISSAKAVLMANLSSCDSDVLSEESQNAGIQDTNSFAPNDLLVLSLVEQMTDHVANLDKENQTNKMVNESLTAEIERYKERVKENESLSTTLTVFKTESKEKESKYIDKEIVLENRNKELENIIYTYVRTEAPSELPKSVESSDSNAQLQEKFFAIAALKNELRKLRGKNVVDTVFQTSCHNAPGNELLVYVSKTCPSLTKPTEKLVVVTPMNKDKKVRFVQPITSSSNIPKQTDSLGTKDSNKPLIYKDLQIEEKKEKSFVFKELQLDDKLNFVEEPVEVMDREIKQLKRSRITIIKVR
ncbi:hypothetical protein Tco_1201931 [Tanacetum coccineum]